MGDMPQNQPLQKNKNTKWNKNKETKILFRQPTNFFVVVGQKD